MCNFISDLDLIYSSERINNGIPANNKQYMVFLPLSIEYNKIKNDNFIIRKGEFTKYLYIKGGTRVYFSDADILEMLLQIKDKKVMNSLLEGLINLYKGIGEEYYIDINQKKYKLLGIPYIDFEQEFTNPQDVMVEFKDLLVLINIILAKDSASTLLWEREFLKVTISKYIVLLKWYYFKDEIAKKYLEMIGYPIECSIYSNYTDKKDMEKNNKIFNQIEKFEKLQKI